MTCPPELRRPPPDSGKLLPDLLALHPLSRRKFGIIPISERYADILLGALDVRNDAINHHQFEKRVLPNEIKGVTRFLLFSAGMRKVNTEQTAVFETKRRAETVVNEIEKLRV